MNIIWIMPECPYPANTGGRIVEWNRLKYLSQNNDIYLFLIVDNESEVKNKEYLLKYCKCVKIYVRQKRKLKILIKSIIYPFPAVSRWDDSMKKDISECYEKNNIELVIVEFSQMLGVLPQNVKNKAKIVLNQHNIEFMSMKSIANHTDNKIKRLIYKVVANQLRIYENIMYKNINILLYTFVSNEDKNFFEEKYNKNNTMLVPIGSEIKQIEEFKESHNLVFIAKMSYQPNETGALWFLNNVWNKVKNNVPDAQLFLVGKDPSVKLINFMKKDESIHVTGTVDDIEQYYDIGNVVIVPLLSGGGVKVKVLEALGHGKIVITTDKGIEGTCFKKDIHVLLANNSDDFGNFCIEALKNPYKYMNIVNNSNVIMREKYSWDGILSKFENKLNEL